MDIPLTGKASPHAGIALRLKCQGKKRQAETASATPRGTSPVVSGRSPGLQVLPHRLPGQKIQWHFDEAALAYRCGGSSGFVQYSCKGGHTAFPFSATE
jgi:hypothetical protein